MTTLSPPPSPRGLVVLDIDGTLAHFMGALRDKAAAQGITIGVEPTTFEMVEPGYFETADQAKAAVVAVLSDMDALESMDLIDPQAAAAVNALVDHGWDVQLATNRPDTPTVRTGTQRWAVRHGLPADSILFGEDAKHARSGEGYARVVVVDDNPYVHADLAAHHPHVERVRFAQPYNGHVTGTSVTSLGELVDYLTR